MKKLFTNDNFFASMTVIAIIGMLFSDIINWVFLPESRSAIMLDLLSVLCVLFLNMSYKEHSKNAMKCLMGALLMLVIVRPVDMIGVYVSKLPLLVVVMFIYALLAVILFVTHVLINSDRRSSQQYVSLNQWLCLLIFICELLGTLILLPTCEQVIVKLAGIIGALAFACVTASIVCVESRLDAYRIDREAAGWSEEMGYPEGYVHEYEKK